MSTSQNKPWTIAFLILLLGIPVTIVGRIWWNHIDRTRPPTAEVAPNGDSGTLDVETTNPASRFYRVVSVAFVVQEMIRPPLPVGEIELQTIVFNPHDYDPQTHSYRRALHNVEMPANGNLNFRFFIDDARYKDWRFRGPLTIYYDERQNPKPLTIENCEIRVR